MKKTMLNLLIGSLCVSAFLGIVIILTGGVGELSARILATTSTIFSFSISGLCCSAIYDKEEYQSFSILGMFTCLLGALLLIAIIWGFFNLLHSGEFLWRLLGTTILLSTSFAHISLMLLIKNKNETVVGAKNLTIMLSVVLDFMILVLIWGLITGSDFYARLLAVVTILITLGTVVTPILNKVYKNVDVPLGNVPPNNESIALNNIQQEIPQAINQTTVPAPAPIDDEEVI